MKFVLTSLLMVVLIKAQAQLHDNMWIFSRADTLFQVDFRENPPYISLKDDYLEFHAAKSAFCDKDGNLLYYTNCIQINNKIDSILENGDSINIGYYANNNSIPTLNAGFFLPAPDDSTRCYFVYMSPEYFSGVFPIPTKVQYALIDMTANNGLGKVSEKRVPILTGGLELNFNHAGAVRHANGRDWWIIVPNRMEPKYYRILLTPNGFSVPQVQEIGLKVPTDNPNLYLGYTLFTLDGTKYLEFENRTGRFQFYDFDRCTGLLSNPVHIQTPHTVEFPPNLMGGFAISPSGKKLYASYGNTTGNAAELMQYDLEAQDILGSQQSIWSCDIPNQYECSIGRMALAPNGKIYIQALIDTVAYHVIHNPDSTGADCGFEYGGLRFPAKYPQSEPSYFPNYRLGPIDGSLCDTLGLNNIPVASFFWDEAELAVDFSNVSYHEPDTYFWDFGDGDTSIEVNPLHNYLAPGIYNTCLTASNTYGSNTICKLVEVDTLPILPVAAFTWDAVELDVNFTNNSYNSPNSFLWDFGDGDTSIEVNPFHAYPAPGTYNTCLSVTNADGSNTVCQQVVVDTIVTPIPPVAVFTWDAVELDVTFMNNSYNSPESFFWEFGDGDTSTDVNPFHVYPAPGTYNTCLTATNVNGSNMVCQQVVVDTIVTPILPVAVFTWDAVELDVAFMNNSYNSPESFFWDFGDGDTSTAANPLHAYPAPGTYNTCLTATNVNGSNMVCQQVVVDTLLDSTSLVVQHVILPNVSVHPNPTTGKVSIEISKPFATAVTWSLKDVLGREVYRETIIAGQLEKVISLAALPDGLYFWDIRNESGFYSGKQVDSGKLLVIK